MADVGKALLRGVPDGCREIGMVRSQGPFSRQRLHAWCWNRAGLLSLEDAILIDIVVSAVVVVRAIHLTEKHSLVLFVLVTDILLVAHGQKVAIVDDDLAGAEVNLVADPVKVLFVLLEDVFKGRLEAVRSHRSLLLQLIAGIAPLRNLVGLKVELIIVVVVVVQFVAEI